MRTDDVDIITIGDVRAAAERIRPHVVPTPVLTSEAIDAELGMEVFFKCENLQRAGAFKTRGATNAVWTLDDETARRGVATHSSGNHAAALARAAARRGIPAHIVMPEDAVVAKVANVVRYGAHLVRCAATLADRERVAAEIVAETGATLVHPFDDPHVIAGQGTAALELFEEVPDLDAVVAPIGGGGLLAGTGVVASALAPDVEVFAAEPAAADDAARSFRAGRLQPQEGTTTIADGLRTSLSPRTFAHLLRFADDVLLVDEDEIVAAMRQLWSRLAVVVEPSGAVPLAALQRRRARLAGRRVGVILSGGNLDLDPLA